jgi:large repetitive protein
MEAKFKERHNSTIRDRALTSCRSFCFLTFSYLFLFLPTISSAGAFTVRPLGDFGHLTVMEVAGNYDAKLPDGSPNYEPRQVITKEFFKVHKDEYDFLYILTNFDFQMPEADARAFYHPIRNDIRGIGLEVFDISESFGSQGKLQGLVDLGNISHLALDPVDAKYEETLDILSHEQLHRWGAYVRF